MNSFQFIINGRCFDVSDIMESCILGIYQQIQTHPQKGVLKMLYGN